MSHENANKYNFQILYIFSKTCFIVKLWEKQSNKSKQVMFQIWGDISKSTILFGRSTKPFH